MIHTLKITITCEQTPLGYWNASLLPRSRLQEQEQEQEQVQEQEQREVQVLVQLYPHFRPSGQGPQRLEG